MKSYTFSIEHNESVEEVNCHICDEVITTGVPMVLCADGHSVCDDCGQKHAPELFECFNNYYEEHEDEEIEEET